MGRPAPRRLPPLMSPEAPGLRHNSPSRRAICQGRRCAQCAAGRGAGAIDAPAAAGPDRARAGGAAERAAVRGPPRFASPLGASTPTSTCSMRGPAAARACQSRTGASGSPHVYQHRCGPWTTDPACTRHLEGAGTPYQPPPARLRASAHSQAPRGARTPARPRCLVGDVPACTCNTLACRNASSYAGLSGGLVSAKPRVNARPSQRTGFVHLQHNPKLTARWVSRVFYPRLISTRRCLFQRSADHFAHTAILSGRVFSKQPAYPTNCGIQSMHPASEVSDAAAADAAAPGAAAPARAAAGGSPLPTAHVQPAPGQTAHVIGLGKVLVLSPPAAEPGAAFRGRCLVEVIGADGRPSGRTRHVYPRQLKPLRQVGPAACIPHARGRGPRTRGAAA